jgi:hypothetical protein
MSKTGPQNADLTGSSCSFHFFIIAPARRAAKLHPIFRFCATHQDVANQFMLRRAGGLLRNFIIWHATSVIFIAGRQRLCIFELRARKSWALSKQGRAPRSSRMRIAVFCLLASCTAIRNLDKPELEFKIEV